MKKLLWSSTFFWRSGHPRPNVGGLETVSKAHDVLLTQPFQSSFVPGKGTPWNPQPYCVLRWFQFLPISISHWQNKQQHTTCILNPRRTMHTIHDRLVTDGSKLGARWCWSIHEQLLPKNMVQSCPKNPDMKPKPPKTMCFTDRHASATNLTVPPESKCLQIKEHKRRCPQQQHLWACGGTSRYETKWSTCGRGNNFARIFTQFDWCSFWTRSCVSFTMLFLAMQIDCKRWQKTEKHGSQQIHNVVLNYPGHAYRRQQQQNKLNSDDFWLVVSFRENCNIWLWNHETTRCKWCNRTTPNCAAGKGAPLVCEHDLPSAVRICYVLMDQDLL